MKCKRAYWLVLALACFISFYIFPQAACAQEGERVALEQQLAGTSNFSNAQDEGNSMFTPVAQEELQEETQEELQEETQGTQEENPSDSTLENDTLNDNQVYGEQEYTEQSESLAAETQDAAHEAAKLKSDSPNTHETYTLAPSFAPALNESESLANVDQTADSKSETVETFEMAENSYKAKALLKDKTAYAFGLSKNAEKVVSNTGKAASLANNTNYLRGYWRVKNYGDGSYSFYSLSSGKALSFSNKPRAGSAISTGGANIVWTLVKCKDGSLSLIPFGYDNLRVGVSGAKLILQDFADAAYQRFFFSQNKPLSEAIAAGKPVANGAYRIESGLKRGFVVDIAGASSKNKANVQGYSSNNTLAQRFWVDYKGNGLYTLSSVQSGKPLDVTGGSKASGTNVWQYAANSTLAQYWYLEKNGSTYTFKSALSGLALDVAAASTKNGANIQVYRPNGTAAQKFKLSRDLAVEDSLAKGKIISDGIYGLYSLVGANKVLDIYGGSLTNGANAQIYAANKTFAQKFEIRRAYGRFYTIRAANSAKYLDVEGGSSASGTNVQQWSGANVRAQLWYFVPNGSSFEIRSAVATHALDVKGGSNRNGANVQVYKPNGSSAQRWKIKEVPLLENGSYVFVSSVSPTQWLAVDGASKKNKANVQMNRMARTESEHWRVSWKDGVYTITNVCSGKVLDVKGGSKANSTNVQQYGLNGSAAQKWRMWIAGEGGIRIQNVGSGKFLDVKGASAKPGANVQQYKGNNSKAQTFIPVSVNDNLVKKGKTGWQNPSYMYQVSAYRVALPNYSRGIFAYVSDSRISPDATRNQVVEAFISRAYNYLGTPYIWDYACAPGVGVDCAGLVLQCMYAVGITPNKYTPHDHYYTPGHDHYANDMWADPKIQTLGFLSRRRGDLICYPGHIAIYLGGDRILHAYPGSTFIANVYSTGLPIRGVKRLFA